jgi:hypothetical protein
MKKKTDNKPNIPRLPMEAVRILKSKRIKDSKKKYNRKDYKKGV